MLTPTQRSMRARMAAHSVHARGRTNTGPATAAAMARFERQVDPEGILPPDERARRAAHARSVYYTGLALKASKARRGDRPPTLTGFAAAEPAPGAK